MTEIGVEDSSKTIRPVDVGGIAGGEKFMTNQLFVKFARDSVELSLYDGDTWAQKAAEHEVRILSFALISPPPSPPLSSSYLT